MIETRSLDPCEIMAKYRRMCHIVIMLEVTCTQANPEGLSDRARFRPAASPLATFRRSDMATQRRNVASGGRCRRLKPDGSHGSSSTSVVLGRLAEGCSSWKDRVLNKPSFWFMMSVSSTRVVVLMLL